MIMYSQTESLLLASKKEEKAICTVLQCPVPVTINFSKKMKDDKGVDFEECMCELEGIRKLLIAFDGKRKSEHIIDVVEGISGCDNDSSDDINDNHSDHDNNKYDSDNDNIDNLIVSNDYKSNITVDDNDNNDDKNVDNNDDNNIYDDNDNDNTEGNNDTKNYKESTNNKNGNTKDKKSDDNLEIKKNEIRIENEKIRNEKKKEREMKKKNKYKKQCRKEKHELNSALLQIEDLKIICSSASDSMFRALKLGTHFFVCINPHLKINE